jgi:hypothetical protein
MMADLKRRKLLFKAKTHNQQTAAATREEMNGIALR